MFIKIKNAILVHSGARIHLHTVVIQLRMFVYFCKKKNFNTDFDKLMS